MKVDRGTVDAHVANMIRIGVLLLPISAALKLAGQYGTFFSTGYGTDDRLAAGIVSGTPYLLGLIGGAILPSVLGIFAIVALHAYLLPTPGRRSATAAAAACTAGLALVLPALGVIGYALPRIGGAYLDGTLPAFDLATGFFTWPWVAIFVPALLYPAGAIALAVLLHRHRGLPRSAAVLFGISAVFIAVPLPIHAARVVGAVLLLAGGTWTALHVRRDLRRGQPQRTVAASAVR